MLQPEIKTSLPQLVVQERAVLYARVSDDDRKHATSGIDSQLADCRKYAQEKSYYIAGEYFEDPNRQTSGNDMLPEIENILNIARQSVFDVLVVREIDRLARNRFKQMSIENTLEQYGVRVEYVIGQYANTAEGKFLKGLMSEFAEYERTKIQQRTHRGRLNATKAGNIITGGCIAPFGYDIRTVDGVRTLVINENEAATVLLIFDLFANKGMGISTIASYLDEHNIPKPAKSQAAKSHVDYENPKGWSIGTLNPMLKSEVYVGRWYYGKTKSFKNPVTGKRNFKRLPKSQWKMVKVPAIINPVVFERVQTRLEQNKRTMGKNRKNFYLLGGMLKCKSCGYGVSGYSSGKYLFYKCNCTRNPKRFGFKCENKTLYPIEPVNRAVWGWIKDILLDKDRLDAELATWEHSQDDNPRLQMITANEAKLEQLHEERQRLIQAYKQGVLTLDELGTEKQSIDKQIIGLERAIEDLRAEMKPTLTQDDKNYIQQWAQDIRKGAELADKEPETQRELFKVLQVSVVLSSEDGKKYTDISCVIGESPQIAVPQYDTTKRVDRPGQ